jgi:hypothetical protein
MRESDKIPRATDLSLKSTAGADFVFSYRAEFSVEQLYARLPKTTLDSSILRIVMTPDARSYAYTYVRAISALYLVEGIR